ncbi:MAG: radical SAM/SPASM domain-containing protein [Acetobacteraceae bacterium]
MSHSAAEAAGQGYLDAAWFLPAIEGPGGFLCLTGWFCLPGPPHRPLIGALDFAGEEFRFPCDLPRVDVSGADARFSLHSGFDVVLPLPGVPDEPLPLRLLDRGRECGSLTVRARHPLREAGALRGQLPARRQRKLDNLILNERERLSHRIRINALPVTGQIDPAFGCNLRCPMCKSQMIRNQGYMLANLDRARLARILDQYGETLVRIWLSLWGEPLLNRQLPEIIRMCKEYDIWVMISSNLSVPMSDAAIGALLDSGIDTIMASVDGASQRVYEQYRRGGSLDLVLHNLHRLAAARARRGLRRPHLYWRYLVFPWNGHELEAARRLALEAGADEFGVESGVLIPEMQFPLDPPQVVPPTRLAPELLAEWRGLARARAGRHQYFGCDYLYNSISINSDGLAHPCCYVVAPSHALGDAAEPAVALRNAPAAEAGRAALAALAAGAPGPVTAAPPCDACDVLSACGGHVITQTSFRLLFEHLVNETPIYW